MKVDRCSLAILCGGKSSRLGTDKGLFAPLGDESLIARGIRLWGQGFAEILVVVRDQVQKDHYSSILPNDRRIRMVTDDDRGSYLNHVQATLTGVLTAVAASEMERVVIVPVDQVGVQREFLSNLLSQWKHLETTGACYWDENHLLPFPSVWSKRSLPILEARLQAGSMSVTQCLRDQQVSQVALGRRSGLKINANSQKDMNQYFGSPLFDTSQRRLHYLRFSLTEACNMSCTYCLPEGYPQWYKYRAKLNFSQICTILKGFRRLGFRKVRFTGGEPLVHPKLLDSIQAAKDIGFETVALTTNGVLIKKVSQLKEAGLDQINFSLDTLDPKTHQKITKNHQHGLLLRNIDTSLGLNLTVKINTVFLRTVNWLECDRLIEWGLSLKLVLRFIELMPTGLNRSFFQQEKVSGDEILPKLISRGLRVVSVAPSAGVITGPAVEYGSLNDLGRIGMINPLSCNFCHSCNRLRVTARGGLRLCLFGDGSLPLPLESEEGVAQAVRVAVAGKRDQHYLAQGDMGDVATFRTIGG